MIYYISQLVPYQLLTKLSVIYQGMPKMSVDGLCLVFALFHAG